MAVAAAVAAVAGLVGGATFVGLGSDPPAPAAADVPERVVAGQADVTAVEARYTITEPGDGGRTFDAHLTYRAPEALALRVRETTAGAPSEERAEADLVVDRRPLVARGDPAVLPGCRARPVPGRAGELVAGRHGS